MVLGVFVEQRTNRTVQFYGTAKANTHFNINIDHHQLHQHQLIFFKANCTKRYNPVAFLPELQKQNSIHTLTSSKLLFVENCAAALSCLNIKNFKTTHKTTLRAKSVFCACEISFAMLKLKLDYFSFSNLITTHTNTS